VIDAGRDLIRFAGSFDSEHTSEASSLWINQLDQPVNLPYIADIFGLIDGFSNDYSISNSFDLESSSIRLLMGLCVTVETS
jgi:hypothetical protein